MITLKDNNISKAFSNIRADKNLKDKTFDNIINKLEHKQCINYKHYIAIISSLILIIGTFIFSYKFYYTEAYAISVDSDISVELSINKLGRVINETYFETQTTELSLENMNYSDALDKICSKATDSLIAIDVLSETDQSKVVNELTNYIDKNNIDANIHCSNPTLREAAHSKGISVGKYKAILQIIEQNPDITIDDLIDVPMRELKQNRNLNNQGQHKKQYRKNCENY